MLMAQVMMTEPQGLTTKDRAKVAEILFETYNIPALCMKSQPILSM
jgi:actin-related protein